MIKRHLGSIISLLLFLAALPAMAVGDGRRFVLVIDAGHGGHDAGACGAFSKEKNINLNVALEFGRLVEANCPDVRVIYTRKTDIFLSLQKRADIANRNKADLFVSIHTNALPKGKIAYGSETYTLGMARAAANLEVAKRENSVIRLEENYKQVYEGFDPSKSESYIIFELMQDTYMKQSVELARCIQRHYVKNGRKDKGVHQAGFLVLRQTSMPAVLTELGFISTPAEEKYLNSKQGIRELGRSIYNGFLQYRKQQGRQSASAPSPVEEKAKEAPAEVATRQPEQTPDPPRQAANQEPASQKKQEAAAAAEPQQPAKAEQVGQPEGKAGTDAPVFKVQLFIVDRRLREGDRHFKGLTGAEYYMEGNIYKYTYGSTTDYSEIRKVQKEIASKFPDSFVVAFQDGKRVDLQEAVKKSRMKKQN